MKNNYRAYEVLENPGHVTSGLIIGKTGISLMFHINNVNHRTM